MEPRGVLFVDFTTFIGDLCAFCVQLFILTPLEFFRYHGSPTREERERKLLMFH